VRGSISDWGAGHAVSESARQRRAGALARDHELGAIERRISTATIHSYTGDAVLGSIDGAVTIFAVVSGVVEAELS
jgi:hypothetical protein